jgi:hypothetical protein
MGFFELFMAFSYFLCQFGVFKGHLVYFVVIWHIFSHFDML